MMTELSLNTKAILLLTAPLILGRNKASKDLLTPKEYKRLAQFLRQERCQPSDLLSEDSDQLLQSCCQVAGLDSGRLRRLLGRGFSLSAATDQWAARSIWVVSRADEAYPRRLKERLRENCPAVLYGCGDISLLGTGGLAVIGSRRVDDDLVRYTKDIGKMSARAGKTLVSGGARGIDQAAMLGALEEGGKACGILASDLQKNVLNRENRNRILARQLTLVSPYDPNAGFNVGNAMQRNKLIYALSDIALAVESGLGEGGTWAGAVEQLEKLHFVPVYVRNAEGASAGLEALRRKGARIWPDPQDESAFRALFLEKQEAEDLLFDAKEPMPEAVPSETPAEDTQYSASPVSQLGSEAHVPVSLDMSPPPADPQGEPCQTSLVPEAEESVRTPADELFSTVRKLLLDMLRSPKKEKEVANELGVGCKQARDWLQRLVAENAIEKKRSSAYCLKPKEFDF